MAIKEIKQHWILTCDCCGAEKNQTGTHRPSTWVNIVVGADALGYSGDPVADATKSLLLCNKCGQAVVAAMNKAAADLRARPTTGDTDDRT